jgi:branched-chain amino acid transport system permease protein
MVKPLWSIGFAVLLVVPLVDLLLPTAWQIAGALPKVFVFALAALGVTVATGWGGLLHLGSAAFLAIGAYTFAVLTAPVFPFAIGFWPGLGAAVVAGAATGVLLGLPTARLRGDYLAIVTLGLGEIVQDVMRNLEPITKGAQGLSALPGPAVPLAPPEAGWPTYYLYLGLLLAVIALLSWLRRSRLGRALVAVREDEIAARCCAVDAGRAAVVAMAVAGALGALAGAMWAALYHSSNDPSTYDFSMSIMILGIAIIGGLGSPIGALVGALLLGGFSLVVLDRLATALGGSVSENVLMQPNNWKFLVYGLALILVMRLRPGGLCAEPRG